MKFIILSFSYKRRVLEDKTGNGCGTDENMNFWGFGIYVPTSKKEKP